MSHQRQMRLITVVNEGCSSILMIPDSKRTKENQLNMLIDSIQPLMSNICHTISKNLKEPATLDLEDRKQTRLDRRIDEARNQNIRDNSRTFQLLPTSNKKRTGKILNPRSGQPPLLSQGTPLKDGESPQTSSGSSMRRNTRLLSI